MKTYPVTVIPSVVDRATSDEGDATIELARLAKALGHPVRVQIMQLLGARDRCYCGDLVDELPLAQATVSQHLKVLRDAGLIQGEIEGPRVCYCASPARLGDFAELLAEVLHTDRSGCDDG